VDFKILGPLEVTVGSERLELGGSRQQVVLAMLALSADAAVSIGRLVTADEVAAVVAFLASPRSVAINGDAIAAGGGTIGAIYY
jgi:NAD(P)-dependent dehydrogenase (short-subunit alcohol dehydrogenase family)